ncbi:uncharacterized protein VTP21DRAFT_1882 [Calcarisporiella thermophila]|uniref:uncharacterized protein n=1 Tax=Calcarisporiella thermophila TaxID=911321 RepID=UPI003743E748
MEVIEENAALLSNYEVLSLLRDLETKQQARLANNPTLKFAENLKTIQFETKQYLEKTPCSSQTPEQIRSLLEALKPYPLTKAEKLTIINQRPRRMVEFYAIVEDMENRFETEKVEEILYIIKEHLPREDDAEQADADEEMEEA